MNVNDSFLVNVTVSEIDNKVEVVMYHGYIREILNVFEGDKAKEIASMLLTRSTVIPDAKVYDKQIGLEEVETTNPISLKDRPLLIKKFNFPGTTVYEEDMSNE